MKASIRQILNPPVECPRSTSVRVRYMNALADEMTNRSSPMNETSSARKKASKPSSQSSSSNYRTNGNRLYSKFPILEVHPTQPIVCYVDTNDAVQWSSKQQGNLSKHNTAARPPPGLRQRIVIQNYITNQTIRVITSVDICRAWISGNNHGSVYDGGTDMDSEVENMCMEQGSITSVQFIDACVVHRHSGRLPYPYNAQYQNHTPPLSTLIIQWKKRIVLFPLLASAQFNSVPVPTISVNNSTNVTNEQSQKSLVEITPSHLNRSHPTSKPIPILSANLLAIGCSDGAIRFFSSIDGKVIKSVRGPNGRLDPVVGMVSVNPRIWGDEWQLDGTDGGDCNESIANFLDCDGGGDGGSAAAASSDSGAHKKSDSIVRILSVCASGTAYLWELQVEFNRSTVLMGGGTKGGAQKRPHNNVDRRISANIKLRPPLAKMYGLGVSPTDSSGDGGGAGSDDNSIPKSPTRTNSAPGFSSALYDNIGTVNLEYDPDRQLLLWTTISRHGANSVNSSHHPYLYRVVIWNLHQKYLPPTPNPKMNGKVSETPVHRCSSIAFIPAPDGSGSTSTSGGGGGERRLILTGLLHPSYPDNALFSVVGSNEGNLSIVVSRYDVNGSTNDERNDDSMMNPISSTSSSLGVSGSGKQKKAFSTESGKLQIAATAVYHKFSMSSMRQRFRSSEEIKKGYSSTKNYYGSSSSTFDTVATPHRNSGDGVNDDAIKLFRMASSPSRPDVILMATDIGIAVVDLSTANIGVVDDSIGVSGAYHAFFSSSSNSSISSGGLGGIITVKGSDVYTTALDFDPITLKTAQDNHHHYQKQKQQKPKQRHPVGSIRLKHPTLVYRSPPALHKSIEFQNRPIRVPPILLPSPSGKFVCLFWQAESRYEILHLMGMVELTKRSSGVRHRQQSHHRRDGSGASDGLMMKGGTGGDSESTEYPPAVDTGSNVSSFAWVGDEDVFALLHPPELIKGGTGDANSSGGRDGFGAAGTMNTITSPAGISNLLKNINVNATTNSSTSGDKNDSQRIDPSKYAPSVELKILVGVNADAADFSYGSIAAATATIIGELHPRGRHSHSPTRLFGGPVLCIGSLSSSLSSIDGSGMTHGDGMAYFYGPKCNSSSGSGADSDNEDDSGRGRVSSYVSIGPALPYPDLVIWDDYGKLCAFIVGRRVAIYLSDPPSFTLLGTALLGPPTNEADTTVESAKFVHGVLYCSTQSSVRCIFLGNIDDENVVCEIDSYTISSHTTSIDFLHNHSPLSNAVMEPTPIPMPLVKPSILTYFHGSLLVSTSTGVHAIPLPHPLLRIGILLAAGHLVRAIRWFDFFGKGEELQQHRQHEILAKFLDRRGVPELALRLPGLSLETIVDICLRYSLTERLVDVVETYGVEGIRQIDMGWSVTSSDGLSTMVCVGAYLLSQEKIDLVRKLATDCLLYDKEGRKEAYILATLLLAVDQAGGKQIIEKAITSTGKDKPGDNLSRVGLLTRENILELME